MDWENLMKNDKFGYWRDLKQLIYDPDFKEFKLYSEVHGYPSLDQIVEQDLVNYEQELEQSNAEGIELANLAKELEMENQREIMKLSQISRDPNNLYVQNYVELYPELINETEECWNNSYYDGEIPSPEDLHKTKGHH